MPSIKVLTWLLVMLLLLLVRNKLLGSYQRTQITMDKVSFWATLYFVVSFFIGSAWGITAVLFYAPEYPSHMVFLLVFMMAHGLVTIPMLAHLKIAYYAYTFPVTLPICFVLLRGCENIP